MALTQIDDRGLKTPIDLIDNEKIRLGTGNDLELYHDGSNSYLTNSTGALHIRNDGIYFKNAAGSENYIDCSPNAEVSLFYDNSKKLETTSEGILVSNSSSPATFKITDTSGSGYEGYLQMRGNDMEIRGSSGQLEFYTGSEDGSSSTLRGRFTAGGNFQINNDSGKIELGTSQDLEIFHNGSGSKIHNNTGRLDIECDQISFWNHAGDETLADFNADGAVELYHNNHKSFNTGSTGISVYGPEGGNGSINLYADEGDDNADFWRIQSGSDGVWSLDNYAAGAYENSIKATGNGNVELYYDNTKMIETTASGGKVNGILEVTSHVKLGDSDVFVAGAGDDLQIYHDGTHSWMTNATGSLVVEADTLDIRAVNNEHYIEASVNGSVRLYHDNTVVFRTTSSGINVGTHTGGQCLNQFNSGYYDYADDTESANIEVNTNVLLFISAQKSNGGTVNYPCALYHITYTGDISRLSQSHDTFSVNSDTDGKICVFKQVNGQFRVKNRTGGDNKIAVTVLHAQGV